MSDDRLCVCGHDADAHPRGVDCVKLLEDGETICLCELYRPASPGLRAIEAGHEARLRNAMKKTITVTMLDGDDGEQFERVDTHKPLIATLPDGSTVALPAGTVLREGMTWDGPPADPLRDLLTALKTNPDPALAVMIGKLVEQIERGSIPLLAQARALLQRARPWIAPGVPDIVNAATEAQPAATIGQLRGEIDAFLAGLPVTSEDAEDLRLAKAARAETGERMPLEQYRPPRLVVGMRVVGYIDGKPYPGKVTYIDDSGQVCDVLQDGGEGEMAWNARDLTPEPAGLPVTSTPDVDALAHEAYGMASAMVPQNKWRLWLGTILTGRSGSASR